MRNVFFIIFLTILQGQELTVPGYECGDCHGTGGWDDIELSNFNHRNTEFTLEGVHTIAKCSDCHKGNSIGEKHDFGNISKSCNSCHLDIHKNNFGDRCTQCHSSITWIVQQQLFDHEETRFSLMNAHRFVDCGDCHDDLTSFDVTPTDCYSCHRNTYDTAENPSHLLAKINTECQECHEVQRSSWSPSSFDHNLKTAYPLTGAHYGAECAGCHQGIFLSTPSDCWSCHQPDFEETGSGQYPQAPDHAENNYNENCEICHTTSQWLGAEVNHDLTAFPLTGSHQNTDCEQCHGTGNYDLPLECAGCHSPSGLAQTDHTTSSYNHDSHNIAEFCQSCHTTSSWQQLIFSHATFSNESCLQCHAPEYEASVDPPHINNNVGTNCQLCHSTENWLGESFTHSMEQTGFVLNGLHVIVDCQSCHVNNVYNGLSVNCESSGCHLATYESTNDPNHVEYGYPADYCDECHNANGWVPIIFTHQLSIECVSCHLPDYEQTSDPVHSSDTGFTTVCKDCHTSTTTWTGASYSHEGITTGCNVCHLDNYNNTTDPNHSDLNISTTCEDCHTSTTTWAGATFSHEGITTGCNNCHMDTYNSTTDPDHVAWGYPNTCEDCHLSTTNWSDANFNHTFPISPNEHQDDTSETCSSCHPDGNANSFTCYGSQCHSVSGMINEHCENGANNCKSCNGITFPYSGASSEECYTCHPNGDEDDCEGGGDDGDGGDLLNKDKGNDSWRNIFLPD